MGLQKSYDASPMPSSLSFDRRQISNEKNSRVLCRRDRQSAGLDPLIDYDFSAFSQKEEKQQPQKVKLAPAETAPSAAGKSVGSQAKDPTAPPIADF